MKKVLLIVLLLIGFKIHATHIVGGEMIYDFLGKDPSGNNMYRITLKIYRDCLTGEAAFDGVDSPNGGSTPAVITVLEANGLVVGVYNIGSPIVTNIPPTINKPCVNAPNTVCVEEGVYTYTLSLPPKTGGYHIVYQRCCRNNTVLNLFQSGKQGSTYYTKIPGPEDAVNNSSPRFNHFPAIFLCEGFSYSFDHSATDPDGDQLIYSFSAPFEGVDGCCTYIGNPFVSSPTAVCPSPPSSCPQSAPPPPYAPVNFLAPYSGSYPVASNPSLTINPFTGKLGGKPNLIGQFVVGVCVEEYRAGKLINRHFRDFQYNIVHCTGVAGDFETPFKCQGNTFTFNNQSFGGSNFFWDFGVPALTNDTSNVYTPTYTFPDTGKYTVTLIADRHKPCSDTVKKTVLVFPALDIDFPPAARQCFKTNSFDFDAAGSFTSSTTYSWNFTPAASPSTAFIKNPQNIVFNEPGKYFVKLYAMHYSCIDSFIDSVRVLKEPVALINNPTGSFCAPANIQLKNGSTGDLPLNYAWTFSNGKSSSIFEPTEVFSLSGIYKATLIALSQGMCSDTTEKELTVHPVPKANFIPTPSVTSIFDPLIEVKNMTFGESLTCKYAYGDIPETTFASYHIYQDYGNYTITQYVTNVFGCKDSLSKIVKVLPEYRFWIPNSFTPDNNSLNDYFKPVVFGVRNYEFEVFNRWGQRIFRTNDPQEGWNGMALIKTRNASRTPTPGGSALKTWWTIKPN